jgi:hypothetical protein
LGERHNGRWALAFLVASGSGCAFNFGGGGPPPTVSGVESAAAKTDIYAHESHTLSNLATLESGVRDYVQSKGQIPGKLEDLVPDFIAEIPRTELGLPAYHNDSSKVEYYLGRVIQKGQVDGSQLKDSGSWGYVHYGDQVIVFVDCTHPNSRGKPWYKERGAL